MCSRALFLFFPAITISLLQNYSIHRPTEERTGLVFSDAKKDASASERRIVETESTVVVPS